MTDQLKTLLETYRSNRAEDDARFAQSTWHWIGETPKPQQTALASIIAPLGYQANAVEKFVSLSVSDAAIWLPLLAFSEIVHSGAVRPSDASIADVERALQELGADARLYSNGVISTKCKKAPWELARAGGEWLRDDRYDIHFSNNAPRENRSSITDSYVLDIGIVGIGRDMSFCFWVMGED